MRPRRVVALLLVAGVLLPLWARPARAQMAVVDVQAIFQLVAMVQQMMQLVGLSTKDLLALASLGTVAGIVTEAAAIVSESEALIAELETLGQGWKGLRDSGRGICTAAGYADWAVQTSQWSQRIALTVMGTRHLMGRAMAILTRLQGLLVQIGSFIGSTSGLMALNAQVGTTNASLGKLMTLLLPQQQQSASVQLMQDVTVEIMYCLKSQRFRRE